jgi:hypothetical protein
LVYITIGALVVIWTAVWYIYLRNNPPENTDESHIPRVFYVCAGLGVTGLVLIVIGLAVGRIGSSARQADLPHAVAPPPVITDKSGQPMAVVPTSPPVAPAPALPAVANPPVTAPAPAVSEPAQQQGPNVVVADRHA